MAMAAIAKKERRVPRSTIERAMAALLKWLNTGKPSSSPDVITLVLTLKRKPHLGRPFSVDIQLPHPFPQPTLLILEDRKTNPNPNPDLSSLPVSEIIPFSRLETLKLRSARVVILDRAVEKKFMKEHLKKIDRERVRIAAVDLSQESLWKEEVRRQCGLAPMRFGGGTGSAVKVGRGRGQSREELVDNVAAAVEAAVDHVPKKWRNVKAVHLKAAESVALPLYQAVAEEEKVTKEVGKEKKRKKTEEGRSGSGTSKRSKVSSSR